MMYYRYPLGAELVRIDPHTELVFTRFMSGPLNSAWETLIAVVLLLPMLSLLDVFTGSFLPRWAFAISILMPTALSVLLPVIATVLAVYNVHAHNWAQNEQSQLLALTNLSGRALFQAYVFSTLRWLRTPLFFAALYVVPLNFIFLYVTVFASDRGESVAHAAFHFAMLLIALSMTYAGVTLGTEIALRGWRLSVALVAAPLISLAIVTLPVLVEFNLFFGRYALRISSFLDQWGCWTLWLILLPIVFWIKMLNAERTLKASS
jgi:hypothetical protein